MTVDMNEVTTLLRELRDFRRAGMERMRKMPKARRARYAAGLEASGKPVEWEKLADRMFFAGFNAGDKLRAMYDRLYELGVDDVDAATADLLEN